MPREARYVFASQAIICRVIYEAVVTREENIQCICDDGLRGGEFLCKRGT